MSWMAVLLTFSLAMVTFPGGAEAAKRTIRITPTTFGDWEGVQTRVADTTNDVNGNHDDITMVWLAVDNEYLYARFDAKTSSNVNHFRSTAFGIMLSSRGEGAPDRIAWIDFSNTGAAIAKIENPLGTSAFAHSLSQVAVQNAPGNGQVASVHARWPLDALGLNPRSSVFLWAESHASPSYTSKVKDFVPDQGRFDYDLETGTWKPVGTGGSAPVVEDGNIRAAVQPLEINRGTACPESCATFSYSVKNTSSTPLVVNSVASTAPLIGTTGQSLTYVPGSSTITVSGTSTSGAAITPTGTTALSWSIASYPIPPGETLTVTARMSAHSGNHLGLATTTATFDLGALGTFNRTASVNVLNGTAVIPDPGQTTINANPGSIIANGTSQSVIQVQLKNSSGANITTNQGTVRLETTHGILGPVTYDTNGRYTANLTSSTTVERATITGWLNDRQITQQGTVNFTVGPAASVRLAGPASALVNQYTSALTLTAYDQYGNVNAPAGSASTFELAGTPGGGTFYRLDAGNYVPTTTITIPQGQSSVQFYYRSSTPGPVLVTATPVPGNNLGDASTAFNVSGLEPATRIGLDGPSETVVGQIVPLQVSTLSDGGVPAQVTGAVTVHLQSSSTGTFFSDPKGWYPITQVTFPAGTSSHSVYYRDTVAGNLTLTATDLAPSGLHADQHSLLVRAGPPVVLGLTGPVSAARGAAAGPYTLTARDMYGNNTAFDTGANIALAGATVSTPDNPNPSAPSLAFYTDSSTSTPIAGPLAVSAGVGSISFYVIDASPTPGYRNITGQDGVLGQASAVTLFADITPTGSLHLSSTSGTQGNSVNLVATYTINGTYTDGYVQFNLPSGFTATGASATLGGTAIPANNLIIRYGSQVIVKGINTGPGTQVAVTLAAQQVPPAAGSPRTFSARGDADGDGNEALGISGEIYAPSLASTVVFTSFGVAADRVHLTGPAFVNAGAVSDLFTLTARDAGGNAMPVNTDTNFLLTSSSAGTVTFYQADGTTALPEGPVTITMPSGQSSVTFRYQDTHGGTPTVTAARASGYNFTVSGTATHTITVNAGAATGLAITTQPMGGLSGELLTTQPVVELRNALGNVVTSDSTTQVTVSLHSGDGGTLGGTMTVTAANGVATFTDLTLAGTVGVDYVLRFTANPALTSADSVNVNVTAGAPTRLVFDQQPTSAAASATISPEVTVRIEDANGNLTDSTDMVTLAIDTNPAGGTLSGTTSVAAVNGVATFGNLSINNVGTGYTLVASSDALAAAISDAFNIGAGTPTSVTLTGPVTSPVAGQTTTLTATVLDAGNNPVPNTPVTFTVVVGNGTLVTLTGTTDADGQVTVDYTTHTTVETATIKAAVTGSTPEVAGNATVTTVAGAPARLSFAQQPTSAAAGATISPEVTVRIEDANGNLTDSTDMVTLAIDTNPAGGTLSGTTSVAAVNGVATFGNLSINNVGTGYTLVASSDALAAAISDAFNIGAGTPTSVTLTGPVTSPVAGETTTLTATVRDASNNPVSNTSVTFTVVLGNGTLVTLTGTTDTNGQVDVDYTTHTTVETATIKAAVTGSTPEVAGSATVTTVAGAPARLSFAQQPTSAAAGATISPEVTVRIEDANGNLTDSTDVVILAIDTNPAGGTLSGTTSVTAENGVATFGNLSINNVGTGYTLAAASGGLAGATSDAFNIGAGTPTSVTLTGPVTSPVAGQTTTLTATVLDAGNNPVPNTPVTFTVVVGNGTLVTLTGMTDVHGQVDVDYTTHTTVETATIKAAVTGSTPEVAGNATVTTVAGAPARLSFAQQPTSAAAGAMISPEVTVRIEDANGNLTDSTDMVTLAIDTNPAGGTLSGTTSVAAVNGVATFGNLSINNVGTGYTLVASSDALAAAISNAFNIGAGTPTSVTLTGPVTSPVAGETTTLTATVLDAGNNPVPNTPVTFTVVVGDGTLATLTGTTDADGQVTVDYTTHTTVETATIKAAVTGSTLEVAGNATVTTVAGAPARLSFAQQPTSAAAGAMISPEVTVRIEDANGNLTDSTDMVTLAIDTNPAGGTLSGTTSVAAVNGVATFGNLSINNVGTGYTLVASFDALAAAISNAFNIGAGTPTSVTLTGPVTSPVAGETTTLTATVLDAGNNPVPNTPVTFTVVVGNGTLVTLTGTTDTNGQVTVDYTTHTTVETATIKAAVTGSTPEVAGNATVTTVAGAPAFIVFTTPARTITAGETSGIITVQLQDSNGNVAVSSGGTTISLTGADVTFRTVADDANLTTVVIGHGESSAGLRATSTVASIHQMNAASPGLIGAQQSLTVTALPPVNRAPVVQPVADKTITAGTPLTVTLLANDPDGDPLTYTVIAGPMTVDANGVLTWTPPEGTDGDFTVTIEVSDGTLITTVIFTVTVTPTPPGNQAPVVQPVANQTVTAGNLLTVQLIASDPDGDTLTYTVTEGPMTIDGNGVLTWTPAKGTSGTFTVTVRVSDGTVTVPLTFTVTVNAATPAPPPAPPPPPPPPVLGLLAGTVMTDVGTPVAGIPVFAINSNGAVVASGPTNGTGHYTFHNLPAGSYTIKVSDVDAPLAQGTVVVQPGGAATLDLVIAATASLRLEALPSIIVGDGRSTSQLRATLQLKNGTPVSGVTVSFAATAGSLSASTALTGTSGVAASTLTAPIIEGIQQIVREVNVTVHDVQRGIFASAKIEITFAPASVSGVVMDNGTPRKPVAGAIVTIRKVFEDGTVFEAQAVTGADGRYTIIVPKGNVNYEAIIQAPVVVNGVTKMVTSTQTAVVGDVSGKGELIAANRTISGHLYAPDRQTGAARDLNEVLFSGQRVVGILRAADGTVMPNPVVVEESGAFRVDNVPVGTYTVLFQVTAPTGDLLAGVRIPVTVSGDGELTLGIGLVDPYGIVTDAVTGEPIQGVLMELFWADTPLNISKGRVPHSRVWLPRLPDFPPNWNLSPQFTTADGEYAWMVWPDGDYYIVATRQGYYTYDSREEKRIVLPRRGEDSWIINGIIHVGETIVEYDLSMQPILKDGEPAPLPGLPPGTQPGQTPGTQPGQTATPPPPAAGTPLLPKPERPATGERERYILGYPDGTFGPERHITRAEVATVVSRILKLEIPQVTASRFGDVPADAWYAGIVEAVAQRGIMVGYPDGTFGPNDRITRAEVFTVMARLRGLSEQPGTPFTDTEGHWAEAILMAVKLEGMVGGYPDGTVGPNRLMTRAEFVVAINRLLNRGPLYGRPAPTWPDVAENHWAYADVESASTNHYYESIEGPADRWVRDK